MCCFRGSNFINSKSVFCVPVGYCPMFIHKLVNRGATWGHKEDHSKKSLRTWTTSKTTEPHDSGEAVICQSYRPARNTVCPGADTFPGIPPENGSVQGQVCPWRVLRGDAQGILIGQKSCLFEEHENVSYVGWRAGILPLNVIDDNRVSCATSGFRSWRTGTLNNPKDDAEPVIWEETSITVLVEQLWHFNGTPSRELVGTADSYPHILQRRVSIGGSGHWNHRMKWN